MFASMCDYFIRQIKIAKHYYISQYKQIERTTRTELRKTLFGAMTYTYVQALASGDMSFFETESGKHMREYLESAVKVSEKEGPKGKHFSIAIDRKKIDPIKHELNIEKASVVHERATQMLGIHNNNAIILLLIRFESFLTYYFMWLIEKYPQKYLSEKCIKYSEVLRYDYENLQKELSLDTANSIMGQPLDEWWKTIKSHKFDLSLLSEHMPSFTETYYRRNLIVHNNGKVNRQYLNGIKAPEGKYRLGETLPTDQQYVLNAFDTVMIIIYGLLYTSLKANPDDREEYTNLLFTEGFNHMVENDWSVSRFIYQILFKDNTQDALTKGLSQINYWISLKNMDCFEDCREEITQTDFSAMNVSLRMAKEMLLENYDTAIPLLDEALLCELTPDNVATWPLFIQFRKTKHYQEFKQKYAAQLDSQVIKSEELTEARTAEHDELKESFKKEEVQKGEQN